LTVDLLAVLVTLALIATCIALGIGLLNMGRERQIEDSSSTMLMWARVGLQGLAITLLLLALLLR
jgi:hypothetical protein